jgi:glycosyltransferase involved in cell wall biosynthesis
MAARLSIFHPPGRLGLGANPFGKDVANLQLYQALARHGGFEQLDMLVMQGTSEADARQALLGGQGSNLRVTVQSGMSVGAPSAAGALLRGQPYLHELAWLRRRMAGDRAYSLIGMIHTLAPPAIREYLSENLLAPVQPWDALICTSPAVRQALSQMFDEYGDFLGERMRGIRPPQPQLPVIPLGVDGEAAAALADRPQVRAAQRAELGLAPEDVLVLWVGRLSFFEKAFPQPMFRAVEQARQAAGRRVVFVMAGWFPGPEDRARYEAAARAHAPELDVRFMDGNNPETVGALWAASDIFLSLVDNIQETFGLTPLEAMAAGRPVVASDWDGYRFTVRHGVEGFLIPTLIGPAGGLGASMIMRHVFETQSYQSYVGAVAQHTAVHVGRAAEALARLIADPELRRRMGEAGRQRVRESFDWKVVAPQMNALVDELARRRAAGQEPPTRHKAHPVKGDPFRDFAGFASAVLTPQTRLALTPGANADRVRAAAGVDLDMAFVGWRADLDECVRAVELVGSGQAQTVAEVLGAFPLERRRAVELSLLWLAKQGVLDWPT